jgi:hypothetical protein
VPLKVDIDPFGFLGSYQAFKLNAAKPEVACSAVIDVLLKDKTKLHSRFIDWFIPVFAESSSFDEAGRLARVLTKCPIYTDAQVRKITAAINDNRQIHESRNAREALRPFLTKHGATDVSVRKAAKRMGIES